MWATATIKSGIAIILMLRRVSFSLTDFTTEREGLSSLRRENASRFNPVCASPLPLQGPTSMSATSMTPCHHVRWAGGPWPQGMTTVLASCSCHTPAMVHVAYIQTVSLFLFCAVFLLCCVV